ncbi:MAG TPA: ABC transporter permease, partial [Rhodoferax sp.]|nr:ABC transporter permease [Rhodoferax sp.]
MNASRRTLISTAVAALALSAFGTLPAQAQGSPKLKVGLMLPYTGTFAALGNAIENGKGTGVG